MKAEGAGDVQPNYVELPLCAFPPEEGSIQETLGMRSWTQCLIFNKVAKRFSHSAQVMTVGSVESWVEKAGGLSSVCHTYLRASHFCSLLCKRWDAQQLQHASQSPQKSWQSCQENWLKQAVENDAWHLTDAPTVMISIIDTFNTCSC